MATNIFISYRKDDSKWNTQLLYEKLCQYFSRKTIFKDFNTIKAGENYQRSIENALKKCNVLLVVMGDKWLNITDDEGHRRLENPGDLVRLEIATALQRNIKVIPVLFDNIKMPSGEMLPQDLSQLTLHQCVSVSETNFEYDFRHLAEAIRNKKIEDEKKFDLKHLLRYRMIYPALFFTLTGMLINKFSGIVSLQKAFFFLLLITPLITSFLVSSFLREKINNKIRGRLRVMAVGSFLLCLVFVTFYIYYFQQHTFSYRGFGSEIFHYIKGNEYTDLGKSLKAEHKNMTDPDLLKKFLGGPGESARLWEQSSLSQARFIFILLFEGIVLSAAVGCAILLELLNYKVRSSE